MTTKLSGLKIFTYSFIGLVVAGFAGMSMYHYKHAKDPKSDIGDNFRIIVHKDSSIAAGLSRRKKSHSKSKKLRRKK